MKKFQKLCNLTILLGLAFYPLSVFALQKNETIYSTLNYDGSSYKTIVSNHLSWISYDNVEDNSELKEILNISGDETYERKENKLSWKAMGNDIFYQGTTNKNLPIQSEIKYFLNEEEKQLEEMLGKEGKIKIQIKLSNQLKNHVKINGTSTELYTPFVTTVGTMLDSKYNKNISINNGKIISTGTRNMVVGLAAPGLYDSVKLDKLKELDEITITYETTNFYLNSIYLVSTPKLLEEVDLKVFHKMDELYNNMYELQKNMDKLEQGTKELEQGANVLTKGSSELKNGLKSANQAINELKNGTMNLEKGLTKVLLSLKNAEQEFAKINLTQSVAELNKLKTQNIQTIQSLLKKTKLTEEQLSKLYIEQKLNLYQGDDINLQSLKSTYELVTLLKANNHAIDTTIKTIQTLNPKLQELLNTLKSAISQLDNGSKQLTNGITKLQAGINDLYNGSITLNNGTNTLAKGASDLSKGATALNKQGIQKLNNYVQILKNYSNKLEALIKLSEEYSGFTSNNSNQTTFISVIKGAKINYKK